MGTPIPRLGAVCVVVVTLVTAAACHRGTQVGNSRHADAVQHARAVQQEAIEGIIGRVPQWVPRDKLSAALWRDEQDFYRRREHAPAWVDGEGLTARVDALTDALRHSADHGLDSSRYGTAGFQATIDNGRANHGRYDVASLPELDARLTFAYLGYAADLLGWSGNPTSIYATWIVTPAKVDLVAQLNKAVSSGNVGQTLEELAPSHSQYKGLQGALKREQQQPTGHLEQIKANLQRWRWTPRDLGERYVLVNVPAYQMQVIEGGKTAVAMRVIVGQPDKSTPLFDDEMTNVVFSPVWNIPESIIRKEMLPKVASDTSYLDRQNIEVVATSGDVVDASAVDWDDEGTVAQLHFRQESGPRNALGLVKFIFPNQFDVYLHDTPNDALFNKPHRALSHGCVRLENPIALAQYVLRDKPEWSEERISAAMNAGHEQAVPLKEHLPVHIVYFTTWVNPDGSVTYTDDPYHIDEKQIAQLRAGAKGAAPVHAVGT